MKPITVNIDTSNKNDIGNVNNVENGKTQNKSQITTRVLRRLRQVNTLLNETSDYYNILKGYIEPDDTLCSSLPKRYHQLQTTQKVTDQHKQKYQQEQHNVTKNNKQEPKSNNTSDKTRKVTCLSAVDDPHLLDLQIGKLTDDDILQLFDA